MNGDVSAYWLADQGSEFVFSFSQEFGIKDVIPYFTDVEPDTLATPDAEPNETETRLARKRRKVIAAPQEDDFTDPSKGSTSGAKTGRVNTGRSIGIGGNLHKLSGAMNGLKHAVKLYPCLCNETIAFTMPIYLISLTWYSWAITGLKEVCAFLTNKGTKNKLLERNYWSRDAVGVAMSAKLKKFHHRIHEDRLNTVAIGICMVLHVRVCLMWGWDPEVLLSAAVRVSIADGSADEAAVHFSTKITVVNAYVTDPDWWAWLAGQRQTSKVAL